MLIAAVTAFWGATSRAATPRVDIDFDLVHSVVTAAGVIAIPPDGSIQSGTLRLSVPVTDQGDPIPGPVDISNLSFSLTADASPFYTEVTGPLSVVQQGTATGTLSQAMDGVVLSSPLFLDRNGTISCSGFFCWLFADAFPLVFAGVDSIPSAATWQVSDLGEPGSAAISETLAVTMNSGSAVFRMLGEERSRTYVPEPGAAQMLAAGGLGLALLGWARRRSTCG
jgi:hypothetical protein